MGEWWNIREYNRCFANAASILYRVERAPVLVLAAALLISIPIVPGELWLVKTLIDRVQAWAEPDPIGPIITAAGWLALLMAVNNIGMVPIPMAMTRLIEIGSLEEQRLLLRKTARLPLAALENPAMKNLRERAFHVSLYRIYDTGCQMMKLVMQAAALIALILAYGHWIPVLVVCAAAFLQIRFFGKSAERLEQLNREQTAARRLLRYYADLMTKREAAQEIRLFGLGPVLASRWSELHAKRSQESWDAVRTAELRKIAPELLMALLGGLLVALIVLLPGASGITAGQFTLLFIAFTLLWSQLPGLIGYTVTMRTEYMRWADFREYMELKEIDNDELSYSSIRPATDKEPESTRTFKPAESTAAALFGMGMLLQVRDLRYRYPGAEKDTLCGVNLTIPQGIRAALVGENGSGKSTLVKLLAGMYAPDGGSIDWAFERQRGSAGDAGRRMSAVFQDFTRLYVTLRENVAIGDLSALDRDEELQGSLRSAGSRLRDLDAQLGPPFGGIEPSGGEWQKIATARALLRNAEFVFFDEPTAALDPQSEREAFELFLRVTEGRSALLVTHRLGAAKLMDKIFVLKGGRLVEEGTHSELMERGGEYCRMFRLQASWYA
ncbi:ATP-binding cassette domain-containing protein [Paenibacillus hamazuiensis]|uniref:ATP-binding cassette domain-containing protein n=1 Tax=Paenibacillus hamazuiensis TaxID=2936508 RepID=UPI00200E0DEF|nr:ABC transporter ATP-binding protein [Paenibacillus hamazuiensis]